MSVINRQVLVFSVASSILLITIQIFRWSLVDILTPFLEPFIEIIIVCFFLAALIISGIYFFKKL
jgi:hypothetical protein